MFKTNNMSGCTARLQLGALAAIIGLGLNACSQSYVVLLPDEDGSIGKVQVTTKEGVTVLENPRAGTVIGGEPGKTFEVGEEQINKDFGAALSASPKKSISFNLYFEEGGARLTKASVADIPKIIAEINRRPAPDISLIGHTDTVGDEKDNARLSLERAKSVVSMLSQVKLDADKVVVESHGEKNLLVPTPDETSEPRNRMVEVTVR
jgi:outer membrane protein OmpA-like peptidoglycan-associated protein